MRNKKQIAKKNVNYLILILSVCLSNFGSVHAQSIESIKKAYYSAANQIALVKNTNQFIPIKDLSNLQSAYITGSFNSAGLYTYIQKYISTPSITAHKIENQSYDLSFNLFFLDIDLNNTSNHELQILSHAIEATRKPYIVLYHHATIGAISNHLFKNAQAVLLSWGDSEYLPIHMAQILFGAIEAKGTLPFKINSEYHINMGIKTSALDRLAYGPPELVNIEGHSFNQAMKLEVDDAIKSDVFPGANLLVAKDGIVIFHEAFGKKKYDDPAPLDKNDLYDLASITKIFAATLGGMKLHSQGIFDPEKTLSTYWPYLRKSNKASLVWKDVLAHKGRLTASITHYRHLLDSRQRFKRGTISDKISSKYSVQINDSLFARKKIPRKLLDEIKRTPLLPKANYVYSDLSMIILGKTIEYMSGMGLDQYVNDNFYQKLGAKHTLFLPTHVYPKNMLIPTEQDSVFRNELVHGYVHDENASLLGGISGHAGLFSNANDMAKIAQLLLNKGKYGGQEYIKSSTVDFFTKYQFPELENRRGLGFDKPLLKYDVNQAHTARDASGESFGHSGFTGTFIWMDPKYNLTYILLTNRVNPTRKNNKISQYSIRPCIQQTIYDHILNAKK